MGVNKYYPHLYVLPEDDANSRIATGFHKEIPGPTGGLQRQMQVLPEAGGWTKVLDLFQSEHQAEMDKHPNRFLVLLIDFDRDSDRREKVREKIPGHLTDRVFVLGVLSEPEVLEAETGQSCEAIGAGMATDCREETDATWGHRLLEHNAEELDRLREHICPILFSSS